MPIGQYLLAVHPQEGLYGVSPQHRGARIPHRTTVSSHTMTVALYIHIPFCRHKCAYCNFNSHAHDPAAGYQQEALYTEALVKEIWSAPDRLGAERRIGSVFVGGGTPSLLDSGLLQQVLRTAREVAREQSGPHGADCELEVTVEANPGSLTEARATALLEAGANRLSLGAQAFDDDVLCQLDRIHRTEAIYDAVRSARRAGFTNLNLDLMFGAPGQSLEVWRGSIERALELQPEHLSLYELTIEKGTLFFRLYESGALQLPDEEMQRAMFAYAMSAVECAGYEHYEISNFARPGRRCLHNQLYWRGEEYLGCGAGAVSCIDDLRLRNLNKLESYVEAMRTTGNAAQWSEALDADTRRHEAVMLGLRMREGIEFARFDQQFGVSFTETYARQLAPLLDGGLIELTPNSCRLTDKGLFVADAVIVEFM